MRNLNLMLLPAILFLNLQIAKAQLPVNDNAWTLQTSLSDEFNSGSVDITKWYKNYGDSIGSAEFIYPTNLLSTGTTLKMRADTLVPNYYEADIAKANGTGHNIPNQGMTFAYQGAAIQSWDTSYRFGYLEIYAKLPSKKYSLWAAFWLFTGSACPSPNAYLNEVDIAENSAANSYAGYRVGNNYHIGDTSCSYQSPYIQHGNFDVDVLPSTDSLSGSFHKFALQWDPHRMIYYFDDVPTTSLFNASGSGIAQHGMTLLLTFGVDATHAWLPADWNVSPHYNDTPTQYPQYFEIDYVHYYKLTSDCSTNTTICVPGDYDRKVKKTIATNNTCTPSFSPSTAAGSYTLRATDSVLLDVGTTINPTGTGYFAIETMACPQ